MHLITVLAEAQASRATPHLNLVVHPVGALSNGLYQVLAQKYGVWEALFQVTDAQETRTILLPGFRLRVTLLAILI